MGLLIASSNIFLINNRAALGTGNGANLVGPRDLFVAALLTLGFLSPKLPLWSRLLSRSPYLTLCKVIVFLTCIGAALGLYNGGNPLKVAQDFVTMVAWALPIAIAGALPSKASGQVGAAVKYVGLLVSLGVFGEVYYGMSIRFVTTHVSGHGEVRPTPTCWPLMMLSATW